MLTDKKYIRHHIGSPQSEFYETYIATRRALWNEEEIYAELAKDSRNLDQISDDAREVLVWILKFFVVGDNIVNALTTSIIDEITHIDIQFLLRLFQHQEDIHNIVYSRLAETYCKDKEELEQMFDCVNQVGPVREMCSFNGKYQQSLGHKLLANIITEGLFFSMPFCYIFWLDEYYHGLLSGLKLANKWIANDEFNHFSTGCKLYMLNPLSKSEALAIIDEGLEITMRFVKSIFKVRLPAMNEILMGQYVEFICYEIKTTLDLPCSKVENPFSWMVKNQMNNSAGDFFMRTLPEYNKPDKSVNNFICLDEDF